MTNSTTSTAALLFGHHHGTIQQIYNRGVGDETIHNSMGFASAAKKFDTTLSTNSTMGDFYSSTLEVVDRGRMGPHMQQLKPTLQTESHKEATAQIPTRKSMQNSSVYVAQPTGELTWTADSRLG